MTDVGSMYDTIRQWIDARSRRQQAFIGIYGITLGWFLVQQATTLSWDFSVYVLIGEYLFGDGLYFEPGRPPVPSTLLGLLGVFGRPVAEHGYVIVVVTLFFFGLYRFARALDMAPDVLAALSANYYVLTYGIVEGTELLSLTALLFMVVGLLRLPQRSGFRPGLLPGAAFGLAALTRYTHLIFLPMLLLTRYWRRLVTAVAASGAVAAPWLLYNHVHHGHMLTSFADSYALNVLHRNELVQPLEPGHFLLLLNLLTPFAILGLGVVLYRIGTTLRDAWHERPPVAAVRTVLAAHSGAWIVFGFGVLAVYQFAGVPFKLPRYLFAATLPAVFVAYHGLDAARPYLDRVYIDWRWIAYGVMIASVITVAWHHDFDNRDRELARYDTAIDLLAEHDREDCAVMANAWPLVAYAGQAAEPPRRTALLAQYIDEGYTLLYTHPTAVPENVTALPVVYRDERFTLVAGDTCKPATVPYDQQFLEQLNEEVRRLRGETVETAPCTVLLDNPVLERLCRIGTFQTGPFG